MLSSEAEVEALYPTLCYHLLRDDLVVWLRWASMERPPSPDKPPAQGIRVELMLNKNPVLGPTIVYRRDLETQPVYLKANHGRVGQILRPLDDGARLDLQLVIHGSIANAPFAALYHLRDYSGEAVDTRAVQATPLLQLQPSTPGDQWHCAGQANLRVLVTLEGRATHLNVVR